MKIWMLMVFASAVALMAMSDEPQQDRNAILDRRRAAIARRMANDGGYVEKVTEGGKVSIVDAQSVVPESALEAAAASIRQTLLLVVDVSKGEEGRKYRPDGQHPVVITMTDGNDDATLMVAPEQCWAVINTKLLSIDSPAEPVLLDRTQKEIWRALAIILGASNSSIQPCVMRQINSLRDLDAVKIKVPCPEPFTMMSMVANHIGLSRVTKASYRQACEEGWAHMPTNDVQRAIWAKVHEIPKNPMKIEFDSKKGK